MSEIGSVCQKHYSRNMSSLSASFSSSVSPMVMFYGGDSVLLMPESRPPDLRLRKPGAMPFVLSRFKLFPIFPSFLHFALIVRLTAEIAPSDITDMPRLHHSGVFSSKGACKKKRPND